MFQGLVKHAVMVKHGALGEAALAVPAPVLQGISVVRLNVGGAELLKLVLAKGRN